MLFRRSLASGSVASLLSPWIAGLTASRHLCVSVSEHPNNITDQLLTRADDCLSSDNKSSRVYFRQFETWQDVRSELSLLKNDIRAIEIAEAINSLKRFQTPTPATFLCEIQEMLMEQLHNLHSRQASDILHGCVRMPFPDGILYTAVLKTIVEDPQGMSELDNRGLSTLVYTLGNAKKVWTDENSVDHTLLRAAARMATDEMLQPHRVDSLDQQTIVSFLYGLGLIPYTENTQLIDYLVDQSVKLDILPLLNEQQFSMFLSALNDLEIKVRPDLWAQFEAELHKKLRVEHLSEQGIANTMRRLGLLNYPYRSTLLHLAQESIKPHRLMKYNGLDITNIVHTIAVHNLDPDQFLSHFEQRILESDVLLHMKEREISAVIHAFALNRQSDRHRLFRYLAEEATKGERITRYSEQSLSVMIYSFGLVKCDRIFALQRLGHECTKPHRLKAFHEQALSNIVYGLGRLRIQDRKLLRIAELVLNEASDPKRLIAFNGQGLSNIIYSLAQLRMPHRIEPFLNEACRSECVTKLNDQGLANVIQAISWLSIRDKEKTLFLLNEVARRQQSGNLTEKSRMSILAAVTKMKNNSILKHYMKAINFTERLREQQSHSLLAFLDLCVRQETEYHGVAGPVIWELSTEERLTALSSEEVVRLLELFRELGFSKSHALPKVVETLQSKPCWTTLSPVLMKRALIALNWLNVLDHQIYFKLCGSLTEDANLEQLEPSDIFAILRSMRESFLPRDLMEGFIDYLCQERLLSLLDDTHLSAIIQMHERFGLRNATRISHCLKEMVKKQRLQRLTLKDTATTLECLVMLGMQEEQEISMIVERLQEDSILEHSRVHYLAKAIMALCQLGKQYKKTTMSLVDVLVKPPWSDAVAEKDLTDLLSVIKEVDYEYGKVGRLLNQNRRRQRTSMFLNANEDLQSTS